MNCASARPTRPEPTFDRVQRPVNTHTQTTVESWSATGAVYRCVGAGRGTAGAGPAGTGVDLVSRPACHGGVTPTPTVVTVALRSPATAAGAGGTASPRP